MSTESGKPKMNQGTRVFIECTRGAHTSSIGGFTRLIRNIVNEAPGSASKFGLKALPVFLKYGSFWSWRETSKSVVLLKENLRQADRSLLGIEKKKKKKIRIAKLVVSIARKFLSFLREIASFVHLYFFSDQRIDFNRGDVLFLADSSINYMDWLLIKKLRKQGVQIGLLVCDICFITHKDLFPNVWANTFKAWFDAAILNVDFIICISETTRSEIGKYIEHKAPNTQLLKKIEVFRLGDNLDLISGEVAPQSEIRKAFDGKRPYLVVASMTPHKNNKYLLDAFELIWSECPEATLCFVGAKGWHVEALVQRIEKHELYQTRLFWFQNISDSELDYCYRHAKALLHAAIVEGFGLPAVEGLKYGLPIFVSDIPIFREVGQEFFNYFDLNDPGTLARIIISIEKSGQMPHVRDVKEYVPITWAESCHELFSSIQKLNK